MVGMALFVFLGEVLFGTLLFVTLAMFIKFWAEHNEAKEAQEAVAEKETAPAAKRVPGKVTGAKA